MSKNLTGAIAGARRATSTRLRAVDYLRVSTEEQVKGYGIAYTGKRTKKHIAKKEWDHVGTYADEGFSGSLEAHQRPDLNRLMQDARQVPAPSTSSASPKSAPSDAPDEPSGPGSGNSKTSESSSPSSRATTTTPRPRADPGCAKRPTEPRTSARPSASVPKAASRRRQRKAAISAAKPLRLPRYQQGH